MPLKKNATLQFWGDSLITAGFFVYFWFCGKEIPETDLLARFCIFGIPALILLLAWVFFTRDSLTRLRWTDSTVELKLLGITLRTYPRPKLQMLCTAVYFGSSSAHTKDMVGLCFFSVDEAAARREKKIAASAVTRGDLAWKKKTPDWQEKLAQEYLHKRLNNFIRIPFQIQKDLIWLEQTEENLAKLREEFPEASWLEVPRNVRSRCL